MATEKNTTPDPKRLLKDFIKQTKESQKNSDYYKESESGIQSSFYDRHILAVNGYGHLKTADRLYNRNVDPYTLRRVAGKAWIINAAITRVQKRITPFLKPSNSLNTRGFVIKKKGEDIKKVIGKTNDETKKVIDFLLNCGMEADSDRDNFLRYCKKIIRDNLVLDQVATEIVSKRNGEPYAFLCVDAATIEKVLPDQDNPDNIKFVQVIDSMPCAYYPEGSLVFDFQNPRSDVRYSFYGYSYVEQAIDLITSCINAFVYNSGFFTENKLPRGMLLLDGNASQETVEQMEDYLYDIMSGSPSNQWRIPIVPAGSGKGGDSATSIKWQPLGGTNKEMEFQQFLDFLISSVLALFGLSADEMGMQLSKAQPIIENSGKSTTIEDSKSLVIGDTLSFLQSYLNRIISMFYPDYELEFTGYEREDTSAVLDNDKKEVETYKTINEKRKEKGLKPLEGKWADEVPMNPQAMQAYQAAQAQENGGMGGLEDPGEDAGMEGGEDAGADEEAWGKYSDAVMGDDGPENGQPEEDAGEEEKEPVEKSMRKSILFI